MRRSERPASPPHPSAHSLPSRPQHSRKGSSINGSRQQHNSQGQSSSSHSKASDSSSPVSYTHSKPPPPPAPDPPSLSISPTSHRPPPGEHPPTRRRPKMPPRPNPVLAAADAQWLFSEEDMTRTPSAMDGMSVEQERQLRSKGVNFITMVGIMLKLPQLTLATASVLLHRFYMRHSMIDGPNHAGFHHYAIGGTALFLATKVEENCRRMKELVVACTRVALKEPDRMVDEMDKEFWRWKDALLANEEILLEAVCFDVSLEQPYNILFNDLVYFDIQNNSELRNSAWAFLNDSLMTTLCLFYPPHVIAAAALYCAAKRCNVNVPDQDGRPWWEILGVKLVDIKKACNHMADVYENSPLKKTENTYLRTPEDTDPANAKTRGQCSPSDVTPTRAPMYRDYDKFNLNTELSGSDDGREGRQSRKRSREASPNSQNNANRDTALPSTEPAGSGWTPVSERQIKRQRTAEPVDEETRRKEEELEAKRQEIAAKHRMFTPKDANEMKRTSPQKRGLKGEGQQAVKEERMELNTKNDQSGNSDPVIKSEKAEKTAQTARHNKPAIKTERAADGEESEEGEVVEP